jgi:Guanylate-binding protein, N-terminal domain
MASWFRGRSGTPGDAGNSAAAQGRPLLLIGFDASAGRWQVGQEALDVLRSLRAPLATISVCGRARQGKSFLLNQLLRTFTGVDRPNGFVVSPTHQSCTRGIWMWSAPVTLSGPDGRKCSAVRTASALHVCNVNCIIITAGYHCCSQGRRLRGCAML